jgi:uncharacterized membrane protein (DUF2068 family)
MPRHYSRQGLLLIGAFKLLKAAALVALGVGALQLLHKDVAAEVSRWVASLDLDPESPYVMNLLGKLSRIDAHKLKALSLGTFVYAGLYFTEGAGLLLRKRWAEYLTIISTAGFIPLEIYEIAQHLTAIRIVLLFVNVAIVLYLVSDLRQTFNERNSSVQ